MAHTFKILVKRISGIRHMRMKIARLDEVRITVPKRATKSEILSFVEKEKSWIHNQMEKLRSRSTLMSIVHTDNERTALSRQARILVHAKLEQFNNYYQYKYYRVSIRNQLSRWGSCSSRGNLNFNYRIALLPEKLQDYLIVHELCHLKEMNHSDRFWKLVEMQIPDYKLRAKQLRSYALEVD